MGTLIGTPPNIVFASLARRLGGVPEVTFVQWLGIGLPAVAAMLPLVYLILTRLVFRIGDSLPGVSRDSLAESRRALGPMSAPERWIAAIFGATALLWIFREDIQIGNVTVPGWSGLLPFGKLIHDGTVAIAMALLLFVIPVDWRRGRFLMGEDWPRRIPWDVAILFGGGFSLAQGFQTSGLSEYLGSRLDFLGGLPLYPMILAICLMMTFLTELTSNTAITTALLPIFAASAAAAGQPALMYMLPATLAASCAFMLPVATPPNAIVFGGGHVTLPQMARAGLIINLTSAPLIAFLVWWLAPLIWAQ
jgi:sodium-dependent dicarboxylate transporter 2/3/5